MQSNNQKNVRHSRASGNPYRAKPKTQGKFSSSQLVLWISYGFPLARE